MALAFELPQHLPRSGRTQDKSTSILTRVGETSSQYLDARLVGSWLTELDSTIQHTKSHLSKRIQDDFPAFERQLESSIVIQTRLSDLCRHIDRLNDTLNDSETGVLSSLLWTLSNHRTVAEQASDADVTHRALAHLLHITEELGMLSDWVQHGQLSLSAEASRRIQNLITDAPSPLFRADIFSKVKKKYRTINDQVVEQLGDAYARSIAFSDSAGSISLTVTATTMVPPTSTEITLPAVLRSFSFDELSTRLSLLRRDIISKFVEPVLASTRRISFSTSQVSGTLILDSSLPSPSPLQSLYTLSTFLNDFIFPHLPATCAAYPATFHTLIATAIMTNLLSPSIPSSLDSLPQFLVTVDEAIQFEKTLLFADTQERPIHNWAGGLAGHYEKKRREIVIHNARRVIMNGEDGMTVRKAVAFKQPQGSQRSPVRSSDGADINESGWNFDSRTVEKESSDVSGPWTNSTTITSSKEHGNGSLDERDPSDEWGWGDDRDSDSGAPMSSPLPELLKISPPDEEDDPWGDDWDAQPTPAPPPIPDPEPSQRVPKLAKRLEKFSAKAKGNGASKTPVASPVIEILTSPPVPLSQAKATPRHKPSPLKVKKVKEEEQETYLVSARATMTLEIAESLMQEGQKLMHSNVFSGHLSSNCSTPGQLLATTAPLVLDLYRALYPVMHSALLARDRNIAIRWANDCRFLSEEVADLRGKGRLVFAEEKWIETGERLKLLGETWFEDVVARQQDVVKNILVSARGFENMASAERFEECKNVIEQVLREITSLARQWKETLTASAYLHALGRVVDDALFKFMDDILCLSDIPETDSERLSELCEMLAPIEELFFDVQDQESVVGSHVSLWFKFSYLSWLIKGSIADISYLFDKGMLIDYEIDELVRLLRALFVETPLREHAIAKVSKGHPVADQADDL